MNTAIDDSFEFERKYLVHDRTAIRTTTPSLIVQHYFYAHEGYAVRLRLEARNPNPGLLSEIRDLTFTRIISDRQIEFDVATLTVKSPSIEGIRYEHESVIPTEVARPILENAGSGIVKFRHHLISDGEVWDVDEFAGANFPLIIAEVEHDEPVPAMKSASFCVQDVTGDWTYTNEILAIYPYSLRP